jgi:hypothetical protein
MGEHFLTERTAGQGGNGEGKEENGRLYGAMEFRFSSDASTVTRSTYCIIQQKCRKMDAL